MFNFGTLGYAGTPAQDCPVTLPTAARNACLQQRKKRLKLAKLKKQQEAQKNKKGLPGLQSQGLPGLQSQGLPGVTSGGSQGRWSPLKTFQGVAPSAQNNAVVSGAYEFFRGQGLAETAAINKALQATRVPSRWRTHYRKYLTDKYRGSVKPRRPVQVRRRRARAARPQGRRFQASVESQTPVLVADAEATPIADYAPNAATQAQSMMVPEGIEDVIYEDELEPPIYQRPLFLLGAAGVLGGLAYYFTKKKG